MRDLTELSQYRVTSPEAGFILAAYNPGEAGVFAINSPTDRQGMHVIASTNDGWDHVSISRKSRTPNWPELEHVRKLCFESHEVVMQLHLPEIKHINCHPHCLHLWRPQHEFIPEPPSWMVGFNMPAAKQAEMIEFAQAAMAMGRSSHIRGTIQ